VNPSYPYDPKFHAPGSVAAQGLCSQHGRDSADRGTCTGEAVVSFQDRHDRWQSGCSLALEQLVESGEIQPPGQGA
jgi:hypothetical protein